VSTSNPVPKIIKNNWSADGNVTFGKPNYKWAVRCLETWHLTYLFPQLCTLWPIFCVSNKTKKWYLKYFLVTDIISVNIHLGSGLHMMNSKILLK
jgi:hypothetical protein